MVHLRSASGRKLDWFLVGAIETLGPHRLGKGCLSAFKWPLKNLHNSIALRRDWFYMQTMPQTTQNQGA